MTSPSTKLTVPNAISAGRMALAPAVLAALVLGAPQWGFWLFALGCLSDAVDGAIARSMQQLSRLGAQIDPLADKLLIAGGMLGCLMLGLLPAWLVALALLRDIGIVAGTIWLRHRGVRFAVQPMSLSKAVTVLQMATVLAVLPPLAAWQPVAALQHPLALVTGALTALTLLTYGRRGISLSKRIEE